MSVGSMILERAMLRHSVEALVCDRQTCADCRRTPLVGERVHLYDKGRIVCELCRPLRRQEPQASELVRPGAPGQAVRITVRAA